eukprot:scaffold1525_cov142-Cylindrotheca_fusiformis.AAC.96
MASTILYKFRSGTTFEALPLPGSAARLFDVKKAIVNAKKLDSGSIEFDLAVRNADTNEEYGNEAMLLPRGTRLIVQRLPAQRGHGFLARMARNEHAGTGMPPQHLPPGAAPSGYYTIESRAGDDDEFVSSGAGNEEKELAALQAATSMHTEGPAMTGGYAATQKRNIAGSGAGGQKPNFAKPANFRPNADPELRDQEKKMMPKKARATGIPRTFLSLSAPAPTDGQEGEENESAMPLLQPNSQGFKDLVNRGGGQSENALGTRRDLDYALKLTATSVPEYLQCGICHNVVKNAMMLPWDPEGRNTCETCIRDGLTQNGFRCPLTGIDGVSPDDLLPNVGVRKAVDMFIKEVMDKVDEIEQQQVEEAEPNTVTTQVTNEDGNIVDGVGTEKGVIVSRKSTLVNRKKEDDDPFGGDDDFGGDVFAVDVEEKVEDKQAEQEKDENKKPETNKVQPAPRDGDDKGKETKEADSTKTDKDETLPKSLPDHTLKSSDKDSTPAAETPNGAGHNASPEKPATRQPDSAPNQQRRERRRGPPVGYTMGPAGASRDFRDSGSDFGREGGRGGRGVGRFQSYQARGGFRGRGGQRGGRGFHDSSSRVGTSLVVGEEVSFVLEWVTTPKLLSSDSGHCSFLHLFSSISFYRTTAEERGACQVIVLKTTAISNLDMTAEMIVIDLEAILTTQEASIAKDEALRVEDIEAAADLEASEVGVALEVAVDDAISLFSYVFQ